MSKDSPWEAWQALLRKHHRKGSRDAEKGVFEPPYPGSDDPQDQEENWAYQSGFKTRRRELGDAFKWK